MVSVSHAKNQNLDLAHRERTAGIETSAKRYKAKALLS
jgi:hypothetical protein